MSGRFFNSPPSLENTKYTDIRSEQNSTMDKLKLATQFVPENWSKATAEDRMYLVQELENQLAREQKREPRMVIAAEFDTDHTLGVYSRSEDCIKINANILYNSGAFEDSASYWVYNTIVHEGFHAYEKDCIEGRIDGADPQKAEEWRKNFLCGLIDGQFVDNYRTPVSQREMKLRTISMDDVLRRRNEYHLQPVEADAFNYAEAYTRNVFEQISTDWGTELAGYEEYSAAVENNSPRQFLIEANVQNPNFLRDFNQDIDFVDKCIQEGTWLDKETPLYRESKAASYMEDLVPSGEMSIWQNEDGRYMEGLVPNRDSTCSSHDGLAELGKAASRERDEASGEQISNEYET